MNNKGSDNIKKAILILVLLVLPLNVFAFYEVVDSRCTMDTKIDLRETANNFTYSFEKVKNNNVVTYNLELLNVDKNISIENSLNKNIYYENAKILNINPGTQLQLYIYASGNTYCKGYKIKTVTIQVPYYNKYSENKLCLGHEDYALCDSTSNLSLTEKEFETQMNLYIESLNKKNTNETETNVEDNTKNPFDLVNFIVKYSDYISGLGWILLVIFIAAFIERANKKRGIL